MRVRDVIGACARVPLVRVIDRLDDVVVGSLLLVIVTVACVGAAIADQAVQQAMRLLGDHSFVRAEYIVLGLEEFGPLLVALTLTARLGAGFAAEVATLQSEGTLDAAWLYRLDPARHTLAPMGVALVVGAAVLGLFTACTWELAGIATVVLRHGDTARTFFRPDAIGLHSVVLCVLKNSTFGALVFLTSLSSGLRARAGAEEVGRATTRAVVAGVVSCLLANLAIDIAWFKLQAVL